MTVRKILLGVAIAAAMAAVNTQPASAADVICYNCPPQWADWATMLKSIKRDLNIEVPHDNKNSGQTLSTLIADKARPVAGLGRHIADRVPVPLVDGVSSAVRQAEALVRLGLAAPTRGSFALPPEKPQKGLAPALATRIGRRPAD